MDAPSNDSKSVTFLNKITYRILGFLVFLLPVFFLPSSSIALTTSKGLLLSLGVVLAFAFFVISLIQDGRVSFPKNLFTLSLVIIPIVFLLSAFVTGTLGKGFVGYSLETGSVLFLILAVFLALLTAYSFQEKEKVFYAYLGFFASFVVVSLFQLIRLMAGPDALSMGVFAGSSANLLGSWNDLALFYGLSAILSLVTLEMLTLNKLFKVLVSIVFVVSLVFLAIVNFSTIWWVSGLFGLMFFLYVVSFDKFSPSQEFARDTYVGGPEPRSTPVRRKISFGALLLLVISLVFIFSGDAIGNKISTALDVTSVEVRPSLDTTFSVIKNTLKESPLFGAGPNNFSAMWLKYKPAGINETIFWNTDFSYGIGLLPTFLVTTGLLGGIAWIFFLVMFLWMGIRSIFQPVSDAFAQYLIVSSFLSALFLWVMALTYVPGIALFALAFFFTGIFAATLYRERILGEVTLSLAHHPKISFVTVLLLVVLLLGGVSLGYLVTEKTIALRYFQKGLVSAQTAEGLNDAENQIIKALQVSEEDAFYRALSEINIIRVDQALFTPNATPEFIREQFQINTANAIENARRATQVGPQNYQNWVSLARVYAALVPAPFSIPGAYENAKKTYEEAFKNNPTNPNIPLLLARLEVSKGDLKAARDYVAQAIALKSNYADAHFLSAQIEVTEGNIAKAIPALETTLILSPNNPGLFFQLGLLKYNDRNWNGAAEAFAKAIQLVPEYANARYFLGLSLERLGDRPNAIAQFEQLLKTNADNQEVALILANLKAGKSPFADVQPPLDNRPEKRETLPIGNN